MNSTLITEQSAAAPPPPQPSTSPAPVAPSPAPRRQPTWQRIILLIVLGYEVLGCLSGGGLLVAAPDGHLMDMRVEGLGGFFPDFFVPGLLLIGLGVLNIAAFVAVWRRTRTDWLFSGLALGGLTVWFLVEIAVVGLHWLQAMWGLPVLLGVVMALPLILPVRRDGRSSRAPQCWPTTSSRSRSPGAASSWSSSAAEAVSQAAQSNSSG